MLERAQLQQQAFAQVARADARRIEVLDDAEHPLDFGFGVERKLLIVLAVTRLRRVGDPFVDVAAQLLERDGEVAVVVDVADEFLGEEALAVAEFEHLHLVAEVVAQVAALDRHRLGLLAILVPLHALPPPTSNPLSRISSQSISSFSAFSTASSLSASFGSRLRLLAFRLGLRLVVVGLDEVEERIREQFLLQVLLEVEQRHVSISIAW